MCFQFSSQLGHLRTFYFFPSLRQWLTFSRHFLWCFQESLKKVCMFLKISLLSQTSLACHLAPGPAVFLHADHISKLYIWIPGWVILLAHLNKSLEIIYRNVTKQEAEIFKVDTGNGCLIRASPTCFIELFWDPQERKYFVPIKSHVPYGGFFFFDIIKI